jgi:hypothetical protein
MDTILTRAPHPPRRSWRGVIAAVAVGLAVLVAFVAVDGLVRDPATINRVTIRNESDDLVDVSVKGEDGSLLPVALVEPGRHAVAHDVVDQGHRWTFVVRVADTTVDTQRLTRTQLEQSGWTVTIPPSGG